MEEAEASSFWFFPYAKGQDCGMLVQGGFELGSMG